MKAVILHDQIPSDANFDHKDVLHQTEAISHILEGFGYEPIEINVTLELNKLLQTLTKIRPFLVFNLVESIEGKGRFIHLVPSILDYLKLPYTGCKTESLFMTSNKIVAKKLLHNAGILTSPMFTVDDLKNNNKLKLKGLYIIKSIWEHASQGIDEHSVIEVESNDQLLKAILFKEDLLGGECIAEKFIEGREFNLSLLASPQGPEVLPPGEIIFEDYPQEKIRIVCYRAKWVEDSFEYCHTPRTFEFSSHDYSLLRTLKQIAKKCWSLFGLHGYARVDFRVDKFNNPFVLEVNTNPCISPDSGYVAAADQAGLTIKQMVKRIIDDALQPASPMTTTKKIMQSPSLFMLST